MRHESKFSTWIRSGGHSPFVLPLTGLANLETKFSVVPDRLLDSIIDDALVATVSRLNQYLPSGVSVDISAVDLTPIRDQLRAEVAARLTETDVAVDPNDPVITAIIARYAEIPERVRADGGLACRAGYLAKPRRISRALRPCRLRRPNLFLVHAPQRRSPGPRLELQMHRRTHH